MKNCFTVCLTAQHSYELQTTWGVGEPEVSQPCLAFNFREGNIGKEGSVIGWDGGCGLWSTHLLIELHLWHQHPFEHPATTPLILIITTVTCYKLDCCTVLLSVVKEREVEVIEDLGNTFVSNYIFLLNSYNIKELPIWCRMNPVRNLHTFDGVPN